MCREGVLELRLAELEEAAEQAAVEDPVEAVVERDEKCCQPHREQPQTRPPDGLQRRLQLGYARAARIVDMMEHEGIVSVGEGSKPREVLVGPEYLETLEAGP